MIIIVFNICFRENRNGAEITQQSDKDIPEHGNTNTNDVIYVNKGTYLNKKD